MEEKYIIESVRKSLRVLKLFSDGDCQYKLSDLHYMSGISKSSLIRILTTLESEGFVISDETTKMYRLGLYFNSMASSIGYSALKNQLYPDLKWASEKSGMLVHFTVLKDMELSMLSRVYPEDNAPVSIAFASNEGGEVPLNATGAGKIIATYSDIETTTELIKNCKFHKYSSTTITNSFDFYKSMEETRELGYALNEGEHEPFLACLSRPIFYANGKLVGALSLSGFKEMLSGENFERINEISIETVKRISRRLGYEK